MNDGAAWPSAAFGNSPSSYHKGRAILHSVFAYGMRQEWCDRNPVDAVEAPRIKEKPIEPLTMEEEQRLERTAERPEHRAMQLSLKLMLYCGVRPTEVTRLNPQRDIVGNELIIRPTTSKTGGGQMCVAIRSPPTTSAASRTSPPCKRKWGIGTGRCCGVGTSWH